MSFNARVTYTANGGTNTFSFSFPYILQSHVKAFVNGTEDTNITFPTASSIQLSSTPANGAVVLIQRTTPSNARLVDFQDGSVLTSADLDQSADQNFFLAQETADNVAGKLGLNASDLFDADNKRIINVATPTGTNDAANKAYVDNIAGSATAAANSATAAQNAQNAAEAALDTFDDRFLGSKSSDPSVDNDGNALVDGALYFDTTNNVMKVYDIGNTQWKQLTPTTSQQTNIDTVANANANITAVAGQITPTNNISTVAGQTSEISTLAGITNLTNLANAHTAITNVSTNLSDVNAFNNTYKISANAPTGIPEGTLWFDTTNDVMKVYDGSAFANAGSSVNGTSQRNKFTATSNQTTFTGNDDDNVLLAYDPNFLDVYLNGVRLVNGSSNDYTATDGSTITLASGASAGDILNVVSFGTFSLASFSATAITSDTLASARLPVVPVTKGGTGLSSLSGNAGKALLVNSSANGFELANASSAEVYGFIKSFTSTTINYTVTVQSVGGSNKYFINGQQQPTLELLEGNTYVFTHPSAHPFRFSTDSGNTSAYTTGVTVNSSTQVTIVVASGAPTLYYYCSSHAGMGGQANTPVPANNTLQVITTNQGADNISNTQYNSFTDTLFSASGFTFSIDGTSGNLIATI